MPKGLKIILSLLVIAASGVCFFIALRKAGTTGPQLQQERDVRPHQATTGPGPGSAGSEVPVPPPAPVAALRGMDSPDSSHPVERAVANGMILDSRIEQTSVANQWIRTRLVRVEVQPRLVRVVELWEVDPITRKETPLSREMFLADQLILKVTRGVDEQHLRRRLETLGMMLDGPVADGIFTVRLGQASLDAVPRALRSLARHPEFVESAEPDGIGFGGGTPDDTKFSEQWGFHNTGQSGGTVDADVDAPEFWDIMEGTPGIVIAVLDSGLNFTHPDLQNIAWLNPGEIAGDGVDNDTSGKIDDVNGWDFVNNDNDPSDDHGHGSNVTGIIAANRNNGKGVAGMLSDARILVCKILNSSNSGLTSNLIAATTYARQRGVPIMNLSLQNYPFSNALNTEFNACQSAGIVLCICAGNQGGNNDTTPNYPSSYTQSNIIAVGNHNREDARYSGSNYGLASVDLFAPGTSIISPVLGTAYASYTGTSQATPFVTAVSAAIKYANPTWTAAEIKSGVIGSVVAQPNYNGICVSGGRLNAVNAVSHAFRHLPEQDADGDRFSNLFEYLAGTRIDVDSNKPGVFASESDGFLRIGVQRVLRPDARLEIETSSDLIMWRTTGVVDFSVPAQLLGGISLSDAPRGFLRIKAIPSP
jgi:subtilisin family serine protease